MSSRFVLLLAILLGLLFFALDLTTLDVQFWMPSLLLPIVVYRWGRRRDIYIIAAFLSLLILINYQLDEGWIFTNALFDHLMPFAVLWIMAWLLVEHRSLQDQLSLQHRQLLHHGQDLADQVQARTAALEASEQKLATIFRTNPGGIAISRLADGRFPEANPAYLAMVGYTHDELVGHTSLELGIITPDERARRTADLNSALAALQRANQLKDEFMAMISHELRNPPSPASLAWPSCWRSRSPAPSTPANPSMSKVSSPAANGCFTSSTASSVTPTCSPAAWHSITARSNWAACRHLRHLPGP